MFVVGYDYLQISNDGQYHHVNDKNKKVQSSAPLFKPLKFKYIYIIILLEYMSLSQIMYKIASVPNIFKVYFLYSL